MAAVAYITVGLVDLPVFHDGGGLDYVQTPAFGYLAGFVPAAWLTGRLAHQAGMNDLARLTLAGFAGVITIQLSGILNLLLGTVLSRWNESLPDLLFSYSLGPLLAQLTLCVAIALIALPIRRLLWIE
jgi:biotin transport system substrate-specific component